MQTPTAARSLFSVCSNKLAVQLLLFGSHPPPVAETTLLTWRGKQAPCDLLGCTFLCSALPPHLSFQTTSLSWWTWGFQEVVASGHSFRNVSEGERTAAWLQAGSKPSIHVPDIVQHFKDGKQTNKKLETKPNLNTDSVCLLSVVSVLPPSSSSLLASFPSCLHPPSLFLLLSPPLLPSLSPSFSSHPVFQPSSSPHSSLTSCCLLLSCRCPLSLCPLSSSSLLLASPLFSVLPPVSSLLVLSSLSLSSLPSPHLFLHPVLPVSVLPPSPLVLSFLSPPLICFWFKVNVKDAVHQRQI